MIDLGAMGGGMMSEEEAGLSAEVEMRLQRGWWLSSSSLPSPTTVIPDETEAEAETKTDAPSELLQLWEMVSSKKRVSTNTLDSSLVAATVVLGGRVPETLKLPWEPDFQELAFRNDLRVDIEKQKGEVHFGCEDQEAEAQYGGGRQAGARKGT